MRLVGAIAVILLEAISLIRFGKHLQGIQEVLDGCLISKAESLK